MIVRSNGLPQNQKELNIQRRKRLLHSKIPQFSEKTWASGNSIVPDRGALDFTEAHGQEAASNKSCRHEKFAPIVPPIVSDVLTVLFRHFPLTKELDSRCSQQRWETTGKHPQFQGYATNSYHRAMGIHGDPWGSMGTPGQRHWPPLETLRLPTSWPACQGLSFRYQSLAVSETNRILPKIMKSAPKIHKTECEDV